MKNVLIAVLLQVWLFAGGALWAWVLVNGYVQHTMAPPDHNPADQQILIYGD